MITLKQHYICKTCGTQFPAAEQPPEACPICQDERQYVGFNGQEWTTLPALQSDHANEIKTLELGLTGIGSQPTFAIGQRALLVQTPAGNVLWDCISLIDDPTVEAVSALGGVSAIAISHPHYYASMIEWSRAFSAPVYLHADDRQWVMRPDPRRLAKRRYPHRRAGQALCQLHVQLSEPDPPACQRRAAHRCRCGAISV